MPRFAESASAVTPPAVPADSTPHSCWTHIVTIVFLAALALVTLDHPSASRIHTWPLSLVVGALWVFPIVTLTLGVARQVSWRLPPPLISAGLALIAGSAIVSAFFSPFSDASLPRVWPTIGGIALYLCLHHTWTAGNGVDQPFNRVALLLAGAGVVLIVASLVVWSRGAWPLPWTSRNTAPFGHSTYTSGAVILLFPWLALQVATARRVTRLFWCVAAAGSLVVLISTSSRGGALALAMMTAAATLLGLFTSRWSRRHKLILAMGVFALGSLAVLSNPRLRELVLHRSWSQSARESNAQRQAMLSAGIRLGLERPLTGWGPGTIPLAYPRVRAQLDGGTENILQLHNTPVQVWATTGLPGALGILLVIGGAVVAMITAPRRPFTLAAAASLFGYAIVALTDHQLDLPFMTVLVAANLAILTATNAIYSRGASRRSARPWTRVFVAGFFATATIVALPATWRELRARQLYDGALAALENDHPAEFIERLDRAAAVAPHDAFFQHQAAAAFLDQRAATRDPVDQASLARQAASRLERSLATGSFEEFAHFNLGWLYLDLGRPDDAARHFASAARRVPDKGGVYFGLGLAHQNAGRRDAAVRCFALEWINDPRSFASPAWEIPTLSALAPSVRDETLRLFARLQAVFPSARTIEAWTRWWWGEAISADRLRPGFNGESRRFVAALPEIAGGEPIAIADSPWGLAYTAWRSARMAAVKPDGNAFLLTTRGDRVFADALAGRARIYGADFREFLIAPTGNEPAFLRTLRRQRIGYGMLALHPEGPPLQDLYVVQENRVTVDLAAGLFPAKGWIPGRHLLELLPELSP